MKNSDYKNYDANLDELPNIIKKLVNEGSYDECEKVLCEAMLKYPHAPHPHNLYGIVLEKVGNHPLAMNHFRAAWALDPSYSPANHNLNAYGSFFSKGCCAYDEDDVITPRSDDVALVYDEKGIGHFVPKGRKGV